MLYFIYELSPTTQSSLLERVQQGDEISWNEFYFRYAPVIRAAGIGFKFNETECDDLIQQVMLKFFNHALTKRRLGVKVLRRFMTIKKSRNLLRPRLLFSFSSGYVINLKTLLRFLYFWRFFCQFFYKNSLCCPSKNTHLRSVNKVLTPEISLMVK